MSSYLEELVFRERLLQDTHVRLAAHPRDYNLGRPSGERLACDGHLFPPQSYLTSRVGPVSVSNRPIKLHVYLWEDFQDDSRFIKVMTPERLSAYTSKYLHPFFCQWSWEPVNVRSNGRPMNPEIRLQCLYRFPVQQSDVRLETITSFLRSWIVLKLWLLSAPMSELDQLRAIPCKR